MGTTNRTLLAAGAALATCVLPGVACYDPTEVVLDLSTDASCRPEGKDAPRTTIYLGSDTAVPDIVAETKRCGAHPTKPGVNDIGTLHFVPRESRTARVIVRIAMTLDGSETEKCLAAGKQVTDAAQATEAQRQCVVARRIVSFVKHGSLPLPVRLDRACAGVLCGDGTTCTTINQGRPTCVDAVVSEDGSPCPGPDCPNQDGGAGDAGDPGDATIDGPKVDGGAPCLGADPSGVVAPIVPAPFPAEHILVVQNYLVWAVSTEPGKTHLYSKDLGNAAAGVESRHSVDGAATGLASSGVYLWLGTKTGLHRFTLPSFMPNKVPDVGSVTGLGAAPGGAYFSGVSNGTTAMWSVNATLALRELIPGVPRMKLAPSQGAQLYGLNPESGTILRMTLGPTSGNVGATINLPTATMIAGKAEPALDGPSGITIDMSAAPTLTQFGWSVGPAPRCRVATNGALAMDANGVYALRTTADDAVVTRCPPITAPLPSGALPDAQPLGAARFGEVHGLALSGGNTPCAYFSARPKGAAAPYSLRAVPVASTSP